jgi:protein TonB
VGGVDGTPGVLIQDGSTASAAAQFPPSASGLMRVRVGGNVQSANLIKKVTPLYPPLAKQARISGTVRFTALIGADGTIEALQLVSGHPLLVPSAQEAVRQWQYKPTLLNGSAVEVITQIDVNYTLSE